MVFTAFALVAMLGVTSLVIDLGFTFGQRRFMQNGADAAALAAAQLLGNWVEPYQKVNWPENVPVFFGINDGDVYKEAYRIAQKNQNPGLKTRTTSFTVKVEYCVAVDNTHYLVDQPGCPSPNSWKPSTNDPNSTAKVPDGTYKVRVTVNSTLTTLFGRVIGQNTTDTSGQGVAVILGVCQQTAVTGNIWPFTVWDQQDFGTDQNTLYELWGSTAPSPPFAGAWQNVLDLSPARLWCNGNPSVTDPDYKWQFPAMVPNTDQGATVNCKDPTSPTDPTKNFAGTDTTWYRNGYAEDPRGGCYVGSDRNVPDLAIWAATTYQGTLRVHDPNTGAIGNKVPTYQDENPAQSGNGGNNVGQGIYGGGTGSLPCVGSTFFFQGATAKDPDHQAWGYYKDVIVFTYDNPEYWKTSTNTWSTQRSGAPGRVELMRILNFRIYQTPPNVSNSRVYGRFVGKLIPPGSNPPICGGPSINGNVVHLGS